jgi:hypothetical protein
MRECKDKTRIKISHRKIQPLKWGCLHRKVSKLVVGTERRWDLHLRSFCRPFLREALGCSLVRYSPSDKRQLLRTLQVPRISLVPAHTHRQTHPTGTSISPITLINMVNPLHHNYHFASKRSTSWGMSFSTTFILGLPPASALILCRGLDLFRVASR